MLKKIWKRLVYIEPGNIYPETFQEELDRQCYTIAFACGFIGFFAWIPYIPIDRIINPHIYIMPYLRLGLSTVCLIMLVIFFMPRFKNQGIIIINIGVAYLFVATGIITAISGAETSYVGGYILVIMLSVIVPLPKLHTYASLGVSLLTFFSICYISDTKFHT
ncbi:MAG TPA: hypothetical protein VEF33_13920, partial [Syntrophales bacterium]|nr:hypothetical protein [Syntrophales bacterium]